MDAPLLYPNEEFAQQTPEAKPQHGFATASRPLLSASRAQTAMRFELGVLRSKTPKAIAALRQLPVLQQTIMRVSIIRGGMYEDRRKNTTKGL
jgi:hypothetical protein